MNVRCSAIVLAAGSGRRMGAGPKKQYLELGAKPLVCHALQAFEDSFTEDVVLVVPAEDIDYCRAEIVERYGFSKVRAVIAGGKERYDSVAAGLRWLEASVPLTHLVFIHDGARPFVTQEMLRDLYDAAAESGAAVAAMPVKNTIKVADENGYVVSTPDRATLWEMQTPQVFEFQLIHECYERYLEESGAAKVRASGGGSKGAMARYTPTDDAQLVERYSDVRVKLVKTSYSNLKVTSPEDLIVASSMKTSLPIS